ncbi:MAG: rod shape-determining protein MreC [Verrucomicrobiota bacterium]|nr:MAG: rod shape-determining protein MreC [Verrucomicrobiota bacterium]
MVPFRWFGWLFLIIAALVCWVKSFSPRIFLQSTTLPFYELVDSTHRKLDALRFKACSQNELVALCTQLWNENTELHRQHHEDQHRLERIQQLEQLMHLGDQLKLKKCYARVIKREVSAWWDQFIINKGSADSIGENDLVVAAISPNSSNTPPEISVIGKIASVQEHHATVILTTSPKFHLAVTLESAPNPTPMIFHGGQSSSLKNSMERRGRVTNIPTSLKTLKPGTTVLPISLQKGVASLALGTVLSLEPQGDGFFLQATVALPSMSNICEVAVIQTHDL